jgi:hypothetical protein
MMKKIMSELRINDFMKYPVWEWDLRSDTDCTIKSIDKYPVSEMSNRIVGTYCKTNSNDEIFCVISNIDLEDPKATDLFITISVMEEDREFYLARYFDVDYDRNGPESLSKWLNKKMEDIFPISWDISKIVSGKSIVKRGIINSIIKNKLTEEEIMKFSLRKRTKAKPN